MAIVLALILSGCIGIDAEQDTYDILNRDWEAPAQARADGPVVYYDSAVPESQRYPLSYLTQLWDLVVSCVGIVKPDPPTVYWTVGRFSLDGSGLTYGWSQFGANRAFIGFIPERGMSFTVKHEYVHLVLAQLGLSDRLNEQHKHAAFSRCTKPSREYMQSYR